MLWEQTTHVPLIVADATRSGAGNHAVRSQDWRYNGYADGSQEFYDHQVDPSEFKNLADTPKHSSIIVALRQQLPATA